VFPPYVTNDETKIAIRLRLPPKPQEVTKSLILNNKHSRTSSKRTIFRKSYKQNSNIFALNETENIYIQ